MNHCGNISYSTQGFYGGYNWFESLIPKQEEVNFDNLLRENKLDIIDDYARCGKKLFYSNSGLIYFIGAKYCLQNDQFTELFAFPNIKKELHGFINHCFKDSNSENTSRNLEKLYDRIIKIYLDNNDEEGLRSLFDQFATIQKNPPSNYIFRLYMIQKQHNMINGIINYLPSSEIKALFSFAHKTGYTEFEEMFAAKNCLSEEDNESLNQKKEWLRKVEDFYPALKSYHIFDRSLSNSHLSLYGGDSVQDIFQKETRKNVEYALWMMTETKKFGTNSEWFNTFLISLGNRRQSIAYLCKSEEAEHFGLPRGGCYQNPLIDLSIDAFMETPLTYLYQNYGDRIHESGPHEVTTIIEKKEYHLTSMEPIHFGANWKAVNCYYNFWLKNDPVFEHVATHFQKIVEKVNFTDEELKNEIATFHWYFANISPFIRGSASIGEVLTDALWLFHGYIPQSIEKGISLDLEAMMCPQVEEFIKIYPMAKKF